MSHTTMGQLRTSYARIIEATLKRVRDSGLTREAGREVVDELGRRWRAAVEDELTLMEARKPTRLPPPKDRRGVRRPLDCNDPGAGSFPDEKAPTPKPPVPTAFRPMDGARFTDPFDLPEAHKFTGGFGATDVRSTDGPNLPGAGREGEHGLNGGDFGQRTGGLMSPKKRARMDVSALNDGPQAQRLPAAPSSVLPPARDSAISGSDGAAAVAPVGAGDEDDDDDEYAGCFDDAEVIESASCAAPVVEKKGPAATGSHHSSGIATPASVGSGVAPQKIASDVDGLLRPSSASMGSNVAGPIPDHSLTGNGFGLPSSGSGGPASSGAGRGKSTGRSRGRGSRASDLASNGDPESSDGSELDSDLDCSEFEEPETNNALLAELVSVRRSRRRWWVQMRHGVLQIDGIESLFSSALGLFEVDEDPAMPRVLEDDRVLEEKERLEKEEKANGGGGNGSSNSGAH